MALLKTLLPPLLLAGLAAGWRRFPGECPQPGIMKNLSLPKYTAHRWYEQKRLLPGGTLSAKCQSYDFSESGNGSMTFVQRQRSTSSPNFYEVRGTLKRLERSGLDKTQASFFYSITGNPINPSEIRPNYNVLHADNDCNIVWDCVTDRKNVSGTVSVTSRQALWIMTSTRSPSENVMSGCYQAISSVLPGFDVSILTQLDQEDCVITNHVE